MPTSNSSKPVGSGKISIRPVTYDKITKTTPTPVTFFEELTGSFHRPITGATPLTLKVHLNQDIYSSTRPKRAILPCEKEVESHGPGISRSTKLCATQIIPARVNQRHSGSSPMATLEGSLRKSPPPNTDY